MVIQLTVLGFILKPIFMGDSPWTVLGYACFMCLVAALEAGGRPSYSYKANISFEIFYIKTLCPYSTMAFLHPPTLLCQLISQLASTCRVFLSTQFLPWPWGQA